MFIKWLLAVALLAPVLSGCGYEACNNLPVCLKSDVAEVQPSGGVLDASGRFGPIQIQPGETRTLALTITRTGLPANDPVYLVKSTQAPEGSTPEVLASVGGIEVRGSTAPFTTETTTVTLVVPSTVKSGQYSLRFGARRVASKYQNTIGAILLDVVVP